MNKICGIYKIESPTGGIYIGQSIDIGDRFSQYKRLKCKRQKALYNSFICHGVMAHSFEILIECESAILDEQEKVFILKYNSFNSEHGMNLTDGGGRGGTVSIETRKKISAGNKGKLFSEETRNKMSIAQKARGHEISKTISIRNKGNKYAKGNKLSPERIRKLVESKRGIPAYMKGKKHSPETIEKMRAAKKGKVPSKETGEKISAALKGRKLTPEWKNKIRLANTGKRKLKNILNYSIEYP